MQASGKKPGKHLRWGAVLLLTVVGGWTAGGYFGRRAALEKWQNSYGLAKDFGGHAVSSASGSGPTLSEAALEYTTRYEGLRDSSVLTSMPRLWTTNAARRTFLDLAVGPRAE